MIKAFDIETMPNMDLVGMLPAPEVKLGNTKDPVKIQAKEEEARKKQIEKMGVNPLYSRIICFVFSNDIASTKMIIEEFTDEAEVDLIGKILTQFADDSLRLFTWNGNDFDIPFVYKRAMILGMDLAEYDCPSMPEFTKRYSDRHTDLMMAWDARNKTKLDIVASMMLGAGKSKIDFRDFPDLMLSEEGRKEILDYCERDVEITFQLGMKMIKSLFN